MSLCTPHYRRTNYDSLAIEQCAEWTLGAVADIADGAVWPVEHPVMGKFNKTWKAKNMGVLQFVAPPTGPSLDVVGQLCLQPSFNFLV
jgi:hypothetical protein